MSKASQTRKKIISAAVRQLAGEDFYHRLQLERIAEKAGISEATIHYHFGKKDDLSKALWDSIVEERNPYMLEIFYKENRYLLTDAAGQRKFIHRMIENYCGFFLLQQKAGHRQMVRLFSMENMGTGKEPRQHVKQYFQRELDAFHAICKEIAGMDDLYQTTLLFLFVLGPLMVGLTHHTNPRGDACHIKLDDYVESIMFFAEQHLLYQLGLAEHAPKADAARKILDDGQSGRSRSVPSAKS